MQFLCKRKHVHTASGKPTQTEIYTYTYDRALRPLTTRFSLNGAAELTLVSNKYDELGRLKEVSHNNKRDLTTSYNYNVRSWITQTSNQRYSQTLAYSYGGNISSQQWLKDGKTRMYAYTYDDLNRLTNAAYTGDGNYNTSYSYDKMGNITSLKRYDVSLVDNLTLTYNGNQLTKVEDAANNTFGFANGANAATEYFYDSHGNLTKDLNKGITNISYNMLSLPSVVTFSNGNTITYLYTADGRKLRTVHVLNGSAITTDYSGNVIYENGVQKLLLTEEGYVNLANFNTYYYYLKDHQGNNRVVVSSSGTVAETNHYYPFGGTFASTNAQPYKYNGKELDTKNGLNWYDYGARHYDAALGRWFAVDPLAEKMYSWNPYGYCFNNPMKFVDENGEVPNIVVGAVIGGIVGGGMAIYAGKSFKEVLAATAGGAVGGAIAATGAAFLGGFIGDATEQVTNLITGSQQDLDVNSMLISSATGSVFGKVGDTFEGAIKNASTKMIESINEKYTSSYMQKMIKNEIKKEVSKTGQKIGNASRKQINARTDDRLKILKKTDEMFIEETNNVVSTVNESINSYLNINVNNWLKENEEK